MNDAEEIVERLNTLVEELESYPDEAVREKALDLSQMILALHGEVLRRILVVVESLPDKEQAISQITEDEVIRSVLLIHGLVTEDFEASVALAVESLRPSLLLQACDVKLVGLENGRAKLRLIRSGKGAPAVAELKITIEKALREAAPGLLEIEIEGMAEQVEATAKAAAYLSSMVRPHNGGAPAAKPVQIKRTPQIKDGAKWISVIRSLTFEEGRFEIVDHADINILICRIDGEFYAYRNACAVGDAPLGGAEFQSPLLACPCHGLHYNLGRRGECEERPGVRLEALPVKVEDDKVKVAL